MIIIKMKVSVYKYILKKLIKNIEIFLELNLKLITQ